MHMRLWVSALMFILALSPATAISHANQPGHFGVGGILGEPTGLSAKYTITDQFAVQGALGLSLIQKGLWVSADFLIHIPNVITNDGKLPLYVGGGLVIQDRDNSGKFKDSRETALGIRGLVGIEWLAQDRLQPFRCRHQGIVEVDLVVLATQAMAATGDEIVEFRERRRFVHEGAAMHDLRGPAFVEEFEAHAVNARHSRRRWRWASPRRRSVDRLRGGGAVAVLLIAAVTSPARVAGTR